MTFRNPKLLKYAKDAPKCFCCDTPNDGTVVACHSNKIADGKGMGIKASDAAIAFMCHACHRDYDTGKHSRVYKDAKFNEASLKTLRWLIESERMKI